MLQGRSLLPHGLDARNEYATALIAPDCDSPPHALAPKRRDAGKMSIHKKICIVGEFGVGKTSLVARYVRSIFSDKYHTTVGVKIDKKEVTVGEEEVTLVLWDLAGESAVSALKVTLVKGAAGFILVADGTRRETLMATKRLHDEVTKILGPVPFILALNKADIMPEWTVSVADIEETRALGWDLRLTSAKDGQGVEQIFADLAARLIETSEEAL